MDQQVDLTSPRSPVRLWAIFIAFCVLLQCLALLLMEVIDTQQQIVSAAMDLGVIHSELVRDLPALDRHVLEADLMFERVSDAGGRLSAIANRGLVLLLVLSGLVLAQRQIPIVIRIAAVVVGFVLGTSLVLPLR